MRKITITRATGGFVIEDSQATEPIVVTRLVDALAVAADSLSNLEYASSLIGDVMILTPTGRASDSKSDQENQ